MRWYQRCNCQPWTITIVALAWSYISLDDGLIIAYAISMIAALIAALIPLIRCYGIPHGWTPDLAGSWRTAVRNAPLAAADAVEWASRFLRVHGPEWEMEVEIRQLDDPA